jgi:hypothetical protein
MNNVKLNDWPYLRTNAWNCINNAIKRGFVTRLPCEICGNPRTHAHHDDYSKPLEVLWLCAKHHKEKHRIHRIPEVETVEHSTVPISIPLVFPKVMSDESELRQLLSALMLWCKEKRGRRKELAAALDVTPNTISHWLGGGVKKPSREKYFALQEFAKQNRIKKLRFDYRPYERHDRSAP